MIETRWHVLLTLAGVWAVVVVSPGPCFVATVQAASRGARRDGVLVALGVAGGTLIWCTGSLLGLAVLFARFGSLYHIVRVAGAIYLAYLGLRTIGNARHPVPAVPTQAGRPAWPLCAPGS